MSAAEITIKVLASITSLYMCFSPAPTMHRIHEERAINSMPLLPLVSQWVYNHTWMLYGYLVQQYFPLLITYAVGSILSVVFLAVYYLNSGDQRRYVLKLVACTLLFNIATTSYTIIGSLVQPSSEAAQIIGACTILCGFLLYASPFATVLDVVRTKNAASIPIAMVAVGAVSNAVWIVYGCFLHDPIIVVPTIVNAVFCVVQLIVYAVYHPNRRSLKAKAFRLHSRLTAHDVPPNAPATSLPTESELEVSFVYLETPRYEEPRTADQLASEV